MATMADVARHAVVSVATVSHVLNGTRTVRPETRQRVLTAIDVLGYTHNTLARSLVTARTRTVGLAVSAAGNPYFAEIIQGVEAGALEHGYGLLLADPHDDPEHELRAVRLLHERRVDGVIVAPSARPSALLAHLARHEVPAVFLDRLVDAARDGAGDAAGTARAGHDAPGTVGRDDRGTAGTGAGDGSPERSYLFDQVCSENTAPMALLVGHLAGLGHRRIGLVAGLPGLSTTTERIAGYRVGLREARLPQDEELVVHGDSDSEAARTATHRLLSRPAPPTALVTGNNAMTIGVLRALGERGLSVPDDLALCCFDDFAWADLFRPRLTAVAQPSRQIGARALDLLLERLADPELPSRTERLPCAFVHRGSCGCNDGAEATPAARSGRHSPHMWPSAEKGPLS